MELESQAMGAKDWHLTGEADASKRPLNSALEVDMDFDTTGECSSELQVGWHEHHHP
jgi:U3 small nucleolar RNA-associated protein MPP10